METALERFELVFGYRGDPGSSINGRPSHLAPNPVGLGNAGKKVVETVAASF